MKFLHISDLHLGLRLYEASLLEDQKFILEKIVDICKEKKTDAVVIAGDIYDKTIPPAEAVELFDTFINSLSEQGIAVLSVAGNHDSGRRVSFGGRIMEKSRVYIEGTYNGEIKKAVFNDEYGEVCFYLLPFIKPAMVKPFFEEGTAESYNDAVKVAIEKENIDFSKRNVMISHQFVTGAGIDIERSESETVFVGGIENVDVSNYEKFDYTALGHIHKKQNVRENIVYSGTPMKYSFAESSHVKCAVLVEMCEKGNIKLEDIVLEPLRDMRKVEGYLKDIADNAVNTDDYILAVLKDEYIINSMEKLKEIYPNALRLEFYKNKTSEAEEEKESLRGLSLPEMFEKFYLRQNGTELDEEGREAVYAVHRKMGGDRE